MTIETSLQAMLLRRHGLLFLPAASAPEERQPEAVIQALELELIQLGFVLSTRLHRQLRHLDDAAIGEARELLLGTLSEQLGSNHGHQPLYTSFPHGIPDDTGALWMRWVLVHFVQGEDQPCLFCGRRDTTHVLSPCRHVVCGHCFDSDHLAGCPVCGCRTDAWPFLDLPLAAPSGGDGLEARTGRRLDRIDLGLDLATAGRELFHQLCRRQQALSPADREDLATLVKGLGEEILAWLPPAIPLRENVALIFGTLLQALPAHQVLAAGRPFLKTATDVLRLIAAYSGADPALQTTFAFRQVQQPVPVEPWWEDLIRRLTGVAPAPGVVTVQMPIARRRFKVAKLPRALRRALLAFLESLKKENLFEDLQRHRSYWIWVGEFLHPGEHRDRYPTVAEGFEILRKKSPDGRPGPRFAGFAARVEKALATRDGGRLLEILPQRPGELARRLDHALRTALRDCPSASWSGPSPV